MQKGLPKEIRATKAARDTYAEGVLALKPKGKAVNDALAAISKFKGIQDPTVKQYRELVKDLIYSRSVLGFNHGEFFSYGMDDKPVETWGQYLSNKELVEELYPRLNTSWRDAHRLGNKFLTYTHLQPYFKREIVRHKKDETADELIGFAQRHDAFIVKPTSGTIGRGIHVVKVSDYESPEACGRAIADEGGVVCEELIKQHPAIAALHPESVNTIRVYSYFDGRTVKVLCPCIRVGRGDSVVDNTGQGGVSASIDAETGVIDHDGYGRAAEVFESHPDTGVKFKGFQIPQWEGLRQTLREIAPNFPGIPLIAWDLSLTENDGWCIVEGNEQGQICYTQMRTKEPLRQQLCELIDFERLTSCKGKVADFKLGWTKVVYDGKPHKHSKPEVTAKLTAEEGEEPQVVTLVKDVDYELVYTDAAGNEVEAAVEAGDYTATVICKGDYHGVASKQFTVLPGKGAKKAAKADAAAIEEPEVDVPRISQEYRDIYGEKILARGTGGKTVTAALEAIATYKGVENPTVEEHRELVKDLLYTRSILGFNHWEFFSYGMEGRSVEEWTQFLSNKELVTEIYPRLNTSARDAHHLGNKYLAYQDLKPYFKREIVRYKKGDPIKELVSFAASHDAFIVKPTGGAIGRGIHVVKVADYESPEACARAIAEEGGVVCEELIKQHHAIAALHPESVNTIRVYSYFDGQNVDVLCPCIRIGRGDSFIDNTGQGGVSANIDVETGIIDHNGCGKAAEVFENHPDTGFRFIGFQIPQWEGLRKMLRQIAPKFPGVPLIAWDLALTADNGWCIVEGNEQGQICCTQIRTKEPMRAALLSKLNWDERAKAAGVVTKMTLGWTQGVCTGEPMVHDEQVVGRLDGKLQDLVRDRDYKLTYTDAAGNQSESMLAAGMYTAVVSGIGDYQGFVSREVALLPKATSLLSAEAVGSDKIHVAWAPMENTPAMADGTFVYYSTNKDFAGAKRFPISFAVATEWDIDKLKSDTVYYIRVCTYKKLDAKGTERLLSSWSAAKAVRTGK